MRRTVEPHAALFGLEHEAAAPIEIDAPLRQTPRPVAHHGAFEHVIIAVVRRVRRLRLGQAEDAAQADQEELVIRAFLPALAADPAGHESVDAVGVMPWDAAEVH